MFSRIIHTSINSLFRNSKNFRCTKTMERAVVKSLENRVTIIERQISNLSSEVADIKKILNDNKLSLTATAKRKFSEEPDYSTSAEIDFKRARQGFDIDGNGYVQVYTDGACQNNGKANAKAGLGVWFGPNHPLNVAEPVTRRPTNNVGEIEACTRAIEIAHNAGIKRVCINTDSEFVINCITKWIHGWQKKGWKTAKGEPVINKDELIELQDTLKLMDDVKWNHIRGHRGIAGNEGADELARLGASKYKK